MLHILSTTIFAHKKYLQMWNTLCDKKLQIFKNIPPQVIPLSEPGATIRNLVIRETKNTLRDLSPGATYELQLYTVFENKESQVRFPIKIFLHRYYKYFYCRPTSRPTSRRSRTPRGGSSSGSVTRQRCSCCGSRPSRPATTPTTRCVDIHVDI